MRRLTTFIAVIFAAAAFAPLRAQSLDAANSAAAKAQAREQLRRFLAPGRGYVPANAQMFRN